MMCRYRIFQTPAEFFFLTSIFFVFYSFVHVFVLRGRRVYSLCQQAGAKSSGEYEKHPFRSSEGFFVNFIPGELKVMWWRKMTSVRFTEK